MNHPSLPEHPRFTARGLSVVLRDAERRRRNTRRLLTLCALTAAYGYLCVHLVTGWSFIIVQSAIVGTYGLTEHHHGLSQAALRRRIKR